MKPRIQKAEVHRHGVILTFFARTARLSFRRKPETVASDLARPGQGRWKPLTVLPPGFCLHSKTNRARHA